MARQEHEYRRELGSRQLQMIAIGGTIGVGLFLGSGSLLQRTGPAAILAYLACGLVAFMVMRALGELAMYRTHSGSFVSYAQEFVNPFAGFVSGWMFWVNWSIGGVSELTAIAIYMHKWFPTLPQWITALGTLGILLLVNLASVKVFGELEFWLAIVKVGTITTFLVVGVALVLTHAHVGGHQAGLGNLLATPSLHQDIFPAGIGVALVSLQSVIFAYNGVEMVGIAAGETRDPQRLIPRAVNSVGWRIALFYCGSVLLLVLVMPWSAYGGGASPFVVVASALGVPAAGDIMNLVVITAAVSSTNSGIYSTGRVLRHLADHGQAPRFTARMSSRGIPVGAVALTCSVYFLGVLLNYVVPDSAFEITMSVAGLGTIVTWFTFLLAHLGMRRRIARGEMPESTFRMPLSPVTNYLTMAFLVGVVCLMPFASGIAGKVTFWSVPVLAVAFALGWRLVRRRAVPVAPLPGEPEPEPEPIAC